MLFVAFRSMHFIFEIPQLFFQPFANACVLGTFDSDFDFAGSQLFMQLLLLFLYMPELLVSVALCGAVGVLAIICSTFEFGQQTLLFLFPIELGLLIGLFVARDEFLFKGFVAILESIDAFGSFLEFSLKSRYIVSGILVVKLAQFGSQVVSFLPQFGSVVLVLCGLLEFSLKSRYIVSGMLVVKIAQFGS